MPFALSVFRTTLKISFVFAVAMLLAPLSRAQALPDGPGKQIVQDACSVCHGTDMVTSKRRSRAEWQETVQDMMGRGAPLLEGEPEILIDYLAKNFGPEKAAQARPNSESRVLAGRVTVGKSDRRQLTAGRR